MFHFSYAEFRMNQVDSRLIYSITISLYVYFLAPAFKSNKSICIISRFGVCEKKHVADSKAARFRIKNNV